MHVWTRTEFEQVRDEASRWVARQYREQVRTILNPGPPRCVPGTVSRLEVLARIEKAYRWYPTLTHVFEYGYGGGDFILRGAHADAIAASIGPRAGRQRLQFTAEELSPALEEMERAHGPALQIEYWTADELRELQF